MNFKLNLSAQASTFSFFVNIIICHLFTPLQIEIFGELFLPANEKGQLAEPFDRIGWGNLLELFIYFEQARCGSGQLHRLDMLLLINTRHLPKGYKAKLRLLSINHPVGGKINQGKI